MNPRQIGLFATFAFIALMLPFQSNGQEVVFLARHVDPQKLLRMDAPIRDDTPLSKSGRQQAETLAERLKDAGVTAIYTSKTARTIQTAEPLAKLLGLQINKMSRRDIDGLIRQLHEKHQGDRVLVVGHWTTLPGILQRLGYPKKVKIERSVRNDLFVVVPRADGPPVVVYIHY
ncbi:MAG: phosphoglycerate mutase family protein [Proteobacteria bacterium]|nr:phosphoglycerate mutase family protein [Pseudomonadota bacterium]